MMMTDGDMNQKKFSNYSKMSLVNQGFGKAYSNANLLKFKKIVINKIIPKNKNIQEILDKVTE